MAQQLRIKNRQVSFISWYPPYLGAGIKLVEISDDFTYCKTQLKLTWWNRNVFGTQFGGSLYAMADPFYCLLLINTMTSEDYVIWDKAATIHFLKPGKTNCFAEFHVPMERVEAMRREVDEAGGKKDFVFETMVKDMDGNDIARVEKVIYVRKK